MATAAIIECEAAIAHEPLRVTLLELVAAVCDVTDSDAEVVATVLYMLETGRVRLSGSFRNLPPSVFC